MGVLMFFILLGLAVLTYFVSKKDLLTPGLFICVAFFGCYCVMMLNAKNWDVNIGGNFVLYVTTALVSFLAAAMLVRLADDRFVIKASDDSRLPLKKVKIDKSYPSNILIVVSFFCCIGYVYKLISDVGFNGSITYTLRLIYNNIVNEDYSPGFIFNQMLEILKAIAYLNTYRLFIRLFDHKDRVRAFKLLIPIALFGITIIVSTDRNILIRYAIYFIVLGCMFYRENSRKKNVNARIGFAALILVAAFAILFFIFGKMKNYSSNFFRSISIYAGSGLNCLNIWLDAFNGPYLHGDYTFLTFHNSIGGLFGFEPYDFSRFEPYIQYVSSNGYVFSSNIYTSLYAYVYDFGYFGVIIFPFIIGLIFQLIYQKAKKNKYGIWWIIYAMLIYSVFFMPISEQFFRRWHLGYIYELFWIIFFYYWIFAHKTSPILHKKFKIKIKVNDDEK